MTVAFKDYLYDKEQSHNRIVWFSKLSVIFNAVMALAKIIMGIYSFSVFLCINAFYNIGIGTAKAIALKGYSESKKRRCNNNCGSRKDEYLWVIAIQPFFEILIKKIPARMYKPLSLGLAAFLVINAAISIAAVSRWGMRLEGIPPMNSIVSVIDRLFPNEFMTRIYPNMRW